MEAYIMFSLVLFVISLSSAAEIRLAGSGSNARQGRVEIFHDGRWGTICDDDWDLNDAHVVCRQLGYTEGAVAACTMMSCGFPIPNNFGEGSGPIWLDNMRCVGTEEMITDCPANPIGDENCMHFEDAGVICTGDRTDIRLAGEGSTVSQGRVEILHNGVWGTICDDRWDKNDADVVCKQLGFAEGATAFTVKAETFGPGSGPIWLDDVNCNGDELSVTSCPAQDIGVENCWHNEDAGVICKDSTGDDTQDTDSTDDDTAWRPTYGGGRPKKRQEDLTLDTKREEAIDDAWERADVLKALSDLLRDLRRK